MALMLYKKYGEKKYLDLVYRYSSFLLNAQNEKGKFKNFMGYDRNGLKTRVRKTASGDACGRLDLLFPVILPQRVKHALLEIFNKAMPMRQILVI